MSIYSAFIGLGSNLGERQKYLQRAVDELKKLTGARLVWMSSVYESDPYGRTDQPRFLNAVVELETDYLPPELLDQAKAIESRLGRTVSERWGPREIDIDILVYDGLVYDTDGVTVPHPDMHNRRFVLVPLKEIAPDLVHPVSGMTVTELEAGCTDHGRVVKSVYHIIP